MYYHYDDDEVPEEMKAEVNAAINTGLFTPRGAYELVAMSFFVVHPIEAFGFTPVPKGCYLSASKTGFVTGYQASPVQKYCQDERIRRYFWGGAYNIPIKAVAALAYRRLRWEANHEPFKDDYLTGEGETYDQAEIKRLKEKAGWDWTAEECWEYLRKIRGPKDESKH